MLVNNGIMPGSAIEIENLTKEYPYGFLHLKKKTSLEGLTMQVETGEVFGLLGPNGAGKSTTIKLLMGLIFPTSGRARLLGSRPMTWRCTGRSAICRSSRIFTTT